MKQCCSRVIGGVPHILAGVDDLHLLTATTKVQDASIPAATSPSLLNDVGQSVGEVGEEHVLELHGKAEDAIEEASHGSSILVQDRRSHRPVH